MHWGNNILPKPTALGTILIQNKNTTNNLNIIYLVGVADNWPRYKKNVLMVQRKVH